MEGTVTGEHGVGLVKRDYLPHELGTTTVDAMRQVSFGLPFRFHFLAEKFLTNRFFMYRSRKRSIPYVYLTATRLSVWNPRRGVK